MATIIKSKFKSAWWLRNEHLQSMCPTVFRRYRPVATRKERFELSDGDFVDLNWLDQGNDVIVIFLHGFDGSIYSHYVPGLLRAIQQLGWRAVFMHFRGSSGEPNRKARFYHSGETQDLQEVMSVLKQRYPTMLFAGIGISLGGNVLLKWIGETAADNPLAAGVAVSAPFDLHRAVKKINTGFARVYQWWLVNSLRNTLRAKLASHKEAFVGFENLNDIRNFWELDSKITAPLHGFKDADDYYTRASSLPYFKTIAVPTLLVQSANDPFMCFNYDLPVDQFSAKLTIELAEKAGHVGFVAGNLPWQPQYWLEKRVPEFLASIINPLLKSKNST